MPSALENIRVLDLSRVLAGPWATQTLGDLGAEVIKVEKPGEGDDTRHWGPPFLESENADGRDAAYFTACNRNKRSVAIDFATPEGADLVRRLAREADVVVENFKAGGLARYGLDYETLRKAKPDIIYCSVTGFGQSGPYAHRPGYDYLIQGMAGLMSITGKADSEPGGGPIKVGVAVADLFTGMYATIAILGALMHRERTGEGQAIDCALFDSQVAMLANQAASWLAGGVEPVRLGNNHPNVVPYRPYATSDGHVIIAVGNDAQFRRLCKALNAPQLVEDSRFSTSADRVRNRDALDTLLGDIVVRTAKEEIIGLLEAASVPCGPINTIPEVFADANVEARGLVQQTLRQDGTTIPTIAFPPKLSRTPARYEHAPPVLGADTQQVLREVLAVSDAEIAKLQQAGIVSR